MEHKKTLLLLFGGHSSEHEVSIMSARNVAAALDTTKYDIKYVYISKDGKNWTLVSSVDERENGQSFFPVLGKSAITLSAETIPIDIAFPVLHGKNGEDGSVQGLLELMQTPYVGPSLESAAITMNKIATKELLMAAELPVVPYSKWETSEVKPDYNDISIRLSSELLFVKPNKAGSSVGVSRVSDASEWNAALDEAAKYDSIVLIEKAIDAREIELAVLGSYQPRVTGAGEILPGEVFYSFDDKYSDDATSSVQIPAVLDEIMLRTLQTSAIKAYKAVQGQGMARVDFFIDRSDNRVYLNEINSIPGFTNISMYPKLWQQEGLSYSELLDALILDALSRSKSATLTI